MHDIEDILSTVIVGMYIIAFTVIIKLLVDTMVYGFDVNSIWFLVTIFIIVVFYLIFIEWLYRTIPESIGVSLYQAFNPNSSYLMVDHFNDNVYHNL